MCYGISSEYQAQKVRDSVLLRAKIVESIKSAYLENPFFEKDDYIPAQFIMSQNLQADKETYLTLEHFNLTKNEIIIVDVVDQTF